MDTLIKDLRYAVRLLWRDRAFALTSLLTVALCIGANAATFSIVNAVLLRPLPFDEPERLVVLYNSYPNAGVPRASNGVPDYFDRLEQTDVFEAQALYDESGVTVGAAASPKRVTSLTVTPSLFRVLRVSAAQGRLFSEEEGEAGHGNVVVLTHELWQELFAGDPNAVGRDLRVNDVPHRIIGVTPLHFGFALNETRLFLPAAFSPEDRSDQYRHSNNWEMIARLKSNRTIAQAQAQIDALNARNLDRLPALKTIIVNAGFHTRVRSLVEEMVAGVRPTLYLLWGAVGFVLLIGAVNLTNLSLVRATARTREIATRTALGARAGQIVRQVITETMVITLAGGVLGLGLGRLVLAVADNTALHQLPRAREASLDLTVVLYTLALAALVGLVVSVLPIVKLTGVAPVATLRDEGRGATSSHRARLVRRVLVTAQIAIALVLLAGAGLLLESFRRVLRVDPGFSAANVLTARVSLPETRYGNETARRAFAERLLGRVRTLPGVQHAGVTSSLPFGGLYSDSVIIPEGARLDTAESLISPSQVVVSPGYFEAMGTRLVRGRLFDERDSPGTARAVIVDEALAKRFWPGQDPIGRRVYQPESAEGVHNPGPDARWFTVVGVVGNMKLRALAGSASESVGAYYFPAQQEPRGAWSLAVKTAREPAALTSAIRAELNGIDAGLPLFDVLTMEERMRTSLASRRLPMLLALGFAAGALFLAAIGIYGVLAFQVILRTREFGIRLALGSDSGGLFRLVLLEGAVLLAVGTLVGLAGGAALRRALESQLYEVGAGDPLVIGGVVAVLAVVTLLACLLPAVRAARVDPVIVLNA